MPWDISDADAKDDRLARAVAEMQAPMQEAERIVTEAIDRNFASESAAGDPWPPLAASTIADRQRKGYGPGPILQRTQTLRGSMKGSHDNESAEVGPSEDIDYAWTHEAGDASRNIPARPYLRVTVSDEQAIENAIWDHLERNDG